MYLAISKLTSVLITSFWARSVRILSVIHCSISGRQFSGILISSLLEADEYRVDTDGGDKMAELEADGGDNKAGDTVPLEVGATVGLSEAAWLKEKVCIELCAETYNNPL